MKIYRIDIREGKEMPASKKTNKNAGKKQTAKKTTAEKSKSKSTRSATAVKENKVQQLPMKKEHPILKQATPYILAIVAVFLGVCIIFADGTVGEGIRNVLTGLFAGCAYVLPIALLIRAILWHRDAVEEQLTARSVCLAIDYVLLTMLLHVIGGGTHTLSVTTHYGDGMKLIGGGVLGGVLGELCLMGFGKVCTIIIVVAVMVILSLFVAGVTLRSAFIYIAYKIKFADEKRKEKKELAEEKRRQAKPSKNQIREEEYLQYLREKKRRKQTEDDAISDLSVDGQMPMGTPAPTVYRIKKRRMPDVNIPVDDVTLPSSEEADLDLTEEMPAEKLQAELENTAADQDAVDEKIFDEVMRRTRERIEKSKKAEGIQAEETVPDGMKRYVAAGRSLSGERQKIGRDGVQEFAAGDVLDAVELAAMGMRQGTQSETEFEMMGNAAAFDADEKEPDLMAEDVPFDLDGNVKYTSAGRGVPPRSERIKEDETDTVKLATAGRSGGEDAFDVSKIFVNPEDAELLNKLSEQYRQPLGVQRSTVSAPSQAPVKPAKPSIPPYRFPPTDILAQDPGGRDGNIKEELQENAVKLVETLKNFRVNTKIENISRGPTITRYELLLDPGVRVRSVVNLVDDISLSLATTGVRIEAPIPGKAAVGIEVPNKKQTTVHLRTLIEDKRFRDAKSSLTVALGEDVAGEAVYFDIAKMPHLLIAGATGSGKSVCINSIITSLLYKASPQDVKLILIDPKKVELSIYNGIPHLLVPVVSEPKKAAGSLSWAVGEMERRYGLIESVGVRDIKGFNEITKNDPDYEYMPRIVIVIDELADLMMTAPDDVEDSICRIAQKARAAGMHLIIGTQRPSVDVITGLIKANVPSRIAFRTSSQIDSRTIIDVGHAANLIGMGDMLFNPVGALKPRRVQGAYVNESDVEEVVAYVKTVNSAYVGSESDKIVNEIEREAQKCGAVSGRGKSGADEDNGDGEDPMLKSAVELAIDSGKISTSLIQRRLSLGYGRAAKLIDRMEQLGYVSAPDGSKPREVLITKSEYMEMRLKDESPFD